MWLYSHNFSLTNANLQWMLKNFKYYAFPDIGGVIVHVGDIEFGRNDIKRVKLTLVDSR